MLGYDRVYCPKRHRIHWVYQDPSGRGAHKVVVEAEQGIRIHSS